MINIPHELLDKSEMMDSIFTEVLISIIVFSLFSFGYTEIIYVNQSLTWEEARSHCTYRHGGRLLTLNPNDAVSDEISSCVPNDVKVWTGLYTKISPIWVTIEGCHSLRPGFPTMLTQYRYYNLTEPSLGECLNTCNPSDRERVALMNNLCVCGNNADFENLEKADDRLCTVSCDVYASCGSNDTFMVYRRSPFARDNEDRYCVTGRCTLTLSVEDRNCDESFRGICGSGQSNPYTDATETFDDVTGTCLENQGSFLIGQAINGFCGINNILSIDFWIGLFRTEYYLYDEGIDCYYTETGVDYRGFVNTTETGQDCVLLGGNDNNYCRNEIGSELTRPWCYFLASISPPRLERAYCDIQRCDQPYRILQVYHTENVLNRKLTKFSNAESSPFLCETDADMVSLGPDEILCNANTETTLPTSTLTAITATPSVPTTTFSESSPDIVDLKTKDMDILTLALSVGIGGVIFLAAAISLILVVHYFRRKNRNQCCNEKQKIQHTFSNKAFVDESSLYQNSDQFDERDSRESYIYQNSDPFDNEIVSDETENGKSNYINSSAITNDNLAHDTQPETEAVYMDQDEAEYDHLRNTDIRHVDRPDSDLYSHTNQQFTDDDNTYNVLNQSVMSQGISEYYGVTQNYRN